MATTAEEKRVSSDAGSGFGSSSTDHEKVEPRTAAPSGDKDVEAGTNKAPATSNQSHTIEPAKAPGATQPTANDASSIPDGGVVAWLQVAGSFSLFFNTWGLLNTFGVFQTYYESGSLFTASSSDIAWIGAVQAFLLLFVGMLAGPIFDRGFFLTLVRAGSFLIVFGFMMTSLCTTFWQVVLAQGFCIGLGGGLLFIPAVAILPTYFRARLGLAIGLAASGSSMGGIIYPIVFYRLINVDKIGFGWATRVLGFIALATLILPCTVMKMRVVPARARALIDTTAFRDPPYLIFVGSTLIGYIGLYVVIFYLSFLGQARGITNESLSFYLVPILNAGSVFGRTVPNALSDKTGTLNMLAPGALVCAALTLGLIGVTNVGGIVVIALLFGFFSGVFIALPPVVISQITKDKSRIGTRMGMAFAALGSAVLIGGPGGGGVLGTGNPADLRWTGLWVFGGVMFAASGVLITFLRMYKAEWKIMAKV